MCGAPVRDLVVLCQDLANLTHINLELGELKQGRTLLGERRVSFHGDFQGNVHERIYGRGRTACVVMRLVQVHGISMGHFHVSFSAMRGCKIRNNVGYLPFGRLSFN